MSGRVGSITTDIIADGLVLNMDAANRASYVPDANTSYNTLDLSTSGSLQDTGMYSSENGGIFVFDGVDDYIQGSEIDSSLIPTMTATCNLWVKRTGGDTSGALFMIGFDAATWQREFFGIQLLSSNITGTTKNTSVSWDANSTVTIASSISADTWYNFCYTINNNTLELIGYVNGAQNATGTISEGNASSLANETYGGTPLWKPCFFPTGGTGGATAGSVGNAQIDNRALSSNEVLHNYNALKGRFS